MPGKWIYVDYNGLYNTTNHNVINGRTNGTIETNLVDEDGTATGFDYEQTGVTYSGGTYSSGFTGSNGIFTEGDRRDGHYLGSGASTGYTIRNLDNAKTYEIRFISSRNVVATNRKIDVTIDGNTQQIDATDNSSGQIKTWTGVAPSSGDITVDCATASGSSFGYMSAIAFREEDAVATGSVGAGLLNGLKLNRARLIG
jgi:hypothetical protein